MSSLACADDIRSNVKGEKRGVSSRLEGGETQREAPEEEDFIREITIHTHGVDMSAKVFYLDSFGHS